MENEREIDFVEIIEKTSEGLKFDESSKQLLYEAGDNFFDKFKIKVFYKDGSTLEQIIDITNRKKEREKMTKIYTSRLHPDCATLNSFLVKNNIDFDWLENDDAEKFRVEILKRKIKPTLPCIIVPAEMCDEADTIYQGDVSKWMEKTIEQLNS